MSHYTGTWATFSCKKSCWECVCFFFFSSPFPFYLLSLLRGMYILIDFCHILSGLAYHSVKTYWLVLLSTSERLCGGNLPH